MGKKNVVHYRRKMALKAETMRIILCGVDITSSLSWESLLMMILLFAIIMWDNGSSVSSFTLNQSHMTL